VELPQITSTYEELMLKKPKEPRAILEERGISTRGLIEKGDYA